MTMEFGSQLANLWKAGIVLVIWVIWNTRNEYRFTNKKTSLSSAFATVWRFIREASLSKSGCMKNTVDDLQILRRLRIPGIPRRAPRIIEVNWKAPPSGWIKVNTDGAAFGAPGLSGCAGIFRTSRSFVKGCFCVPLGISYAFEAELAAAIYAVKYAYMFRWRRLWLELDSAYVVALLQTRSSSVP